MMKTIGLIDYGSGNFRSVYNALCYLNKEILTVTKPEELSLSRHIILPGVGSYHALMENLKKQELLGPLLEKIKSGDAFYLGICAGMQVLSDRGEEFGEHDGFGVIEGVTRRINTKSSHSLKLPLIGWHKLKVKNESSPLFHNLEKDPYFYFIHSYQVVPTNTSRISSVCEYGEEITASIEKDNMFGVQFHPEKSQLNGLKLLNNFCSL